LSAMHLEDYYQSYRLVVAYIAILDSFLATRAPGNVP